MKTGFQPRSMDIYHSPSSSKRLCHLVFVLVLQGIVTELVFDLRLLRLLSDSCVIWPQLTKMPSSPTAQHMDGTNLNNGKLTRPPCPAAIPTTPPPPFRNRSRRNPPKKNMVLATKFRNCLSVHSGYQNPLEVKISNAKRTCSVSWVVTGCAIKPNPPTTATAAPVRTRAESS